MSRARTGRSWLVLGAALLLITGCSRKGDVSGWKATVEIIDGVKTIRNPETPRYGTFAFDLVEDLALGEEKDEAYFFPQSAFINIDDQGRFFVCDIGNRRVQVYDRDGAYVRTLGRSGQGPGEYVYSRDVLLDRQGDAYINSGRLVVFGPDGIFKKNVLIKTASVFILGPGGTFVGSNQPNLWEEGGPRNKLIQIGPDGEMLRTIATFPVNGASPGQLLNHWYVGKIAYCPRSDDSFYYGFSLDYIVHVADGEGRELFAFSKAEESREITGREADLTRESGLFIWYGQGDPKTAPLDMPDHRPFFTRFYNDDLGRLYIIRFKPITEKDVTLSDIDVFSKDGYYLCWMTWPFVPQVIKGGFLYEVRQDEEAGLTKIIRHRIKNWADFKAE